MSHKSIRHIMTAAVVGALWALPFLHIVTYAGAFDVHAKEHMSMGMTVISVRDVVRSANSGDRPEGNLRHLIRALEQEGIIKRTETKLESLAAVGVISFQMADALQENQRPTYECVVREWC